jgi:hypothetical protein
MNEMGKLEFDQRESIVEYFGPTVFIGYCKEVFVNFPRIVV